MQQRKDEILAKKAKLAELKRQRELRQKEFSASRQSTGDASELISPTPGRAENRKELDSLISSLVGDSKPSSTEPKDADSGSQIGPKGSRPISVPNAGQLSGDTSEPGSSAAAPTSAPQAQLSSRAIQNLSTAPFSTVYEYSPSPVREVYSYSKGVQTTEPWSPQRDGSPDGFIDSGDARSSSKSRSPRASKRLSRREREQEEELRQSIRKEVEQELKALKDPTSDGLLNNTSQGTAAQQNYPARTLSKDELNAVTSSDDFLDFVERSSKVIERALDQEYDVLADYALGGANGIDDEDDELGGSRGKKGRRVREVAQFWDERSSKKRMVSDLGFSPKFPELVLASYTKNPSAPHEPHGLVQIWNTHLHSRPEYVFHAQSDILTAKFSPFHPNLIIGGAYSGQVLLWDTRAKSTPVQKTPLSGAGHTHPVYSISIVGTPNAHNILSCSTDGIVCAWTVDMFTQPSELLALHSPPPPPTPSGLPLPAHRTDDLAPTALASPPSDPTTFLVGTEQGTIYPVHRYDRAGYPAGIDTRLSYRGHAAPVMSLSFHPARGPVDLGDLFLSSSLDWSVKIWKVKGASTGTTAAAVGAGSTGAGASTVQHVAPILELAREDVVYDAQWSPVKPGVFALVDGGGNLEVWDITVDTEVPVAKVQPSMTAAGGAGLRTAQGLFGNRSLNKCAWDEHEGKRVAVGGLDGVVSVFEVGSDLGGLETARAEDWALVKKLIGRLDGGR
ncbi:MAG: hypothetical protein M1827_006939 [Pycnora praestabilis]|nr:MAG: hypothetical protein M1827_006939 [Pycnora praestabilis]